jgi:hypothetical protein
MDIKDTATSSARFSKNAGAAQPYYLDGVKGAGQKWKAAVDAADDTWAAGVQAAISRGAFKKGVGKAGADYYSSRASKLGGARYQQGVQEGAANWQEGFQPYADKLKSLSLSPGGPRGDARNQNRTIEVQIAMRQLKESIA